MHSGFDPRRGRPIRSAKNMKILFSIVSLTISCLAAQTNESLCAHAKYKRENGKVIIQVFIKNGSREEIVIPFVGSFGVTRDGDFYMTDVTNGRSTGIIGTPAPRFTFKEIEFTAPSIKRALNPSLCNKAQTRICLPAGDSVEYYRFSVPSEWIASGFLGGAIDFPTINDGKPISVPITQFSEVRFEPKAEQTAPSKGG